MKYALLCATGIFLALASVAVAQNATWAWTGSKAETMVKRDATVRLPQQERAALASELRAAVAQYLALEQAAAFRRGSSDASRARSTISVTGRRPRSSRFRVGSTSMRSGARGPGRLAASTSTSSAAFAARRRPRSS